MAKQSEGQARRSSHCPEVVLWRAVVEQAKRDLGLSDEQYGSRPDERDRVVAWIGTVDFVRCCFNADLDPEAVEAEFRRVIEEREIENDGTFD